MSSDEFLQLSAWIKDWDMDADQLRCQRQEILLPLGEWSHSAEIGRHIGQQDNRRSDWISVSIGWNAFYNAK